MAHFFHYLSFELNFFFDRSFLLSGNQVIIMITNKPKQFCKIRVRILTFLKSWYFISKILTVAKQC